MSFKITVFTPTYNRAYIIEQCYKSLCRQTYKNFEWLIVDDGSSDETKEMVDRWVKENQIQIRYFYQQNGGKHRAFNKGIEESNGQLFICVDSDDYLTNDSLQIIVDQYENFKDDEYAGMIALRGNINRKPMEKYFPSKVQSATIYELYYKHNFIGDIAIVYKVEILKNYRFKVIENEKMMFEGYLYNQIDMNYKMYILNEVLYICEYLSDGYTKNFRKYLLENPKSVTEIYNQYIKLAHNANKKIKFCIIYIGYSILAKNIYLFKESNSKLLTILLTPLGFLYYLITLKEKTIYEDTR